jgi:hypothetical protein
MTGDGHVRFCESGRGRLPPATHLKGGRWRSGTPTVRWNTHPTRNRRD